MVKHFALQTACNLSDRAIDLVAWQCKENFITIREINGIKSNMEQNTLVQILTLFEGFLQKVIIH